METKQVQIKAQAKINLTLAVGKLTETGMHTITSKMARIALCDTLEVTRLDNHALSRYAILWHEDAPRMTEIDWPVTRDLAVRAHRALEEKVGNTLPVQMKLQKRIPVGGGLGGGSADAAAMLQATISLFNLDVNPHDIATTLGSDIPFFLSGGAGIVSGIGDVVNPVELDEMHVVLIVPEYSCSTADVYKAFATLQTSPPTSGENDLLTSAFIVEKRLKQDMEELQTLTGKEIHLSGSGSTMFIICNNEDSANQVVKQIKAHTQHVALATRTC
jgi:4-diphosphocytidyl-2-C-methyl-D-erythritol kinase